MQDGAESMWSPPKVVSHHFIKLVCVIVRKGIELKSLIINTWNMRSACRSANISWFLRSAIAAAELVVDGLGIMSGTVLLESRLPLVKEEEGRHIHINQMLPWWIDSVYYAGIGKWGRILSKQNRKIPRLIFPAKDRSIANANGVYIYDGIHSNRDWETDVFVFFLFAEY